MGVENYLQIRDYLDNVVKRVEDTLYEMPLDKAEVLLEQIDNLTQNFASKSLSQLELDRKQSLKNKIAEVVSTLPDGYRFTAKEVSGMIGQGVTPNQIKSSLSYHRDEFGVSRISDGIWTINKQQTLPFVGGGYLSRSYGQFRDEILGEAEKLLEQNGHVTSSDVAKILRGRHGETRGKYSHGLGPTGYFSGYVREVLKEYAQNKGLGTSEVRSKLILLKCK